MFNKDKILPFTSRVSFGKLLEQYGRLAESEAPLVAAKAKKALAVRKTYPEFGPEFLEVSDLEKYKEPVDALLEDVFSETLSGREIKVATVPFRTTVIKASEAYKEEVGAAVPNIENLSEAHLYIWACTLILKECYGHTTDFKRPFYYEIPDKNGVSRYYKLVYTTDLITITPTEEAPSVTQEEVEELLDNFDNIELWKEKFPAGSYVADGIMITTLCDMTAERAISTLKSTLSAKYETFSKNFIEDFQEAFRTLLNVPDLNVGFIKYDRVEDILAEVTASAIKSYILDEEEKSAGEALDPAVYEKVMEAHKNFTVSNIKHLSEKDYPKLYHALTEQDMKSAILAPVVKNGMVLGIMEMVSPAPNALNSLKAHKMSDVMPYIETFVLRSGEEEKNQIKAIIQRECTSIHPSVFWKFQKEARRFLNRQTENLPATFREIVFKDVYALYGQIDIKNSSLARNEAIQKDLRTQLNLIIDIFKEARKTESLPIYDEYNFRLKSYLNEVKEQLKANTEQKILDFLEEEIHPVMKHLKTKTKKLKARIDNYKDCLYDSTFIYHYRKDYDDTVTIINKRMSEILDEKQEDAQKMFPHFFEKYKTDGVEHSMYIGASIINAGSFNEIYLQNLRLWQLQVMCEMEKEFYKLQPDLPVSLDVTSMLLVYSTPIAIRYRMDEHHFDVDGTYNARYEVIKKRLDKAHIKGTEDRITQKGKIAIIYSQKKDEKEYLRYSKLLQAKEFISENVEILHIESLQGISGLKAIRVEILFKDKGKEPGLYTYDELSKEFKLQ